MRPEGWKNPYPYNPEPTSKLPNTAYNAFEAGADAMLEGLKKEAWNHIIPGNYVETDADGYKYHEPDVEGYLVFIEEE
ncbi:hypothetical protein LCGC14_1144370 [marine sediment metagenome]|uniref:Uncharacterized protein n=1 Tax=marine sediment metagenome TaxID=412755 RepID=A0A0F9Q333_9ZZZZ